MFLGTWCPGGAGFNQPPDDSPPRADRDQRPIASVASLAKRWYFEASNSAIAVVGELALDGPETHADILQILAHHGDEAFESIDGIFALAVWDKRADRLLLARDALGRRPLYCAARGDSIVFGSSASHVARAAGRPAADLHQLADYLLQRRGAGPRSFFTGVRRVLPGSCHVIEGRGGRRHDHSWWRPDFSPVALDDDALLHALDEQLDRSVAAIRARHAKLVAHLSAGLDSSLAVATLSRQLPPGERLVALCASPAVSVTSDGDLGIADEYPVAAETAAMLGNVDVTRIVAPDDDWITASDRFAAAAGMPYRNPANLGWLGATYQAARAGGAGAVVESVQGNLTLGYEGSGAVPAMIAHGRIGGLVGLISDVRRHGLGSGLLTLPWGLFRMFPARLADPLAALVGVADSATNAFVRPEHPSVRTVRHAVRSAGGWWRMERASRCARSRIEQLDWADQGAHASAVEELYGVELADPFTDRKLVELTLRIDEPRFLHEGRGRGFARRLLAGRVPAKVASGTVIWQQGTDWRSGAIGSSDTALADLDYAAADPSLAALFDVPRLRLAVTGWTAGPEDRRSLETAGGVMRAIGAIRFVRWVASLEPAP